MAEKTPLPEAVRNLSEFFGPNPLEAIRRLELGLPSLPDGPTALEEYLRATQFSTETLRAAMELKRLAGQVNVLVHASGIVASLRFILEPGERILSVSLGAGNTGKDFDLETDRRIAEFKFISWRGGPEAIRQNQVFKDYLKLLWDQSGRRKQLFLTGTREALRFLRGGRAIDSVLSRNVALKETFMAKYGGRFVRVGEFFRTVEGEVELVDLSEVVPLFSAVEVPAEKPPLEQL